MMITSKSLTIFVIVLSLYFSACKSKHDGEIKTTVRAGHVVDSLQIVYRINEMHIGILAPIKENGNPMLNLNVKDMFAWPKDHDSFQAVGVGIVSSLDKEIENGADYGGWIINFDNQGGALHYELVFKKE